MGPTFVLGSPFPTQNPFTCKDLLGSSDRVASIANKKHVWEQELKHDVDRSFLMEGICNGFRIIEPGSVVTPVETQNHKSALLHSESVEKELRSQIIQGNYIVASEKPAVVSPLAAIPKGDGSGDIRLIHDGSRPVGQAMNDYATLHSERFQTIQDACSLAKPGYWCAKVDLKAAYRSVPIHCNDYRVTGLKWQFAGEKKPTYLFDARLPFGATKAPSHFHRLSQAIRRCLQRRGFKGVVVYIDDFLVVAPTYKECNEALHTLIGLVRQLGFLISWNKVVGPTQRITFLGVDIDTTDCTLSLGEQKLQKIEQMLQDFSGKKRACKRQLQQLAGLLNWACQAISGGKFFLRRILDSIKPLQQQHHKTKLSLDFQKDVQWWLTFVRSFNGVVYYGSGDVHHVHVDACNKACGAFWAGDWEYTVFHRDIPRASGLHINYKEVCGAVQAVRRWAPFWANSTVIVHTDSTVTKAVLNKGRSRCAYVNDLLRQMCWLSVKYNFVLRAIHVPGLLNTMPDTISRLHESGKMQLLQRLLCNWHHGVVNYDLSCHMTQKSLDFLLQEQRRHVKRNYS